ncbi:MAG: tyrosine-protein phosphatase [Ferrimicrobium sp.]
MSGQPNYPTPIDAHLTSDNKTLWFPSTLGPLAIAEVRDPMNTASLVSTGRFTQIRLSSPDPAPVVELRDLNSKELLVANRRIRLQGATNLRDAGGIATTTGPALPWRRVYRSENLARLTEPDWQTLNQLGITTIIDLRNDQEREAAPTLIPRSSPARILSVPIVGDLCGVVDATSAILEGRLRSVTADDMALMYQDIVAKYRESLIEVTELLTTNPDPTLVHCTAGKDRTGIVIALWQLHLGADPFAVVEDYLRSSLLRTIPRFLELRDRFALAKVNPRDVHPYLSTSLKALTVALDALGLPSPARPLHEDRAPTNTAAIYEPLLNWLESPMHDA